MRKEAKEYPSFPLGSRLYIRLGLYSRAKTFHTPSKLELYFYLNTVNLSDKTIIKIITIYFNLYKHDLKI